MLIIRSPLPLQATSQLEQTLQPITSHHLTSPAAILNFDQSPPRMIEQAAEMRSQDPIRHQGHSLVKEAVKGHGQGRLKVEKVGQAEADQRQTFWMEL